MPEATERTHAPRPALGYAMVLTAATLFAVNGTVSKVILESGVSALRLSEIRATGAFLGLGLVVALTRPGTLRLRRHEVPILLLFGVCGLAFVQWFYFVAIHRLAIGVALLIQYLAPLLVALWTRLVLHRPVRRRIWAALALALVGLSFVLELGGSSGLDGIGVAASLLAAATYALYILVAEREVERRDAVSLTAFGFFFAALFWAVVQPWWTFPGGVVDDDVSLLGNLADASAPVWLLMLWMVVLGTIAPFGLIVGALRHVSATRVGIIAMFEPVAATLVAFLWLGESLGPAQLGGGALVLGGIALAQTARELRASTPPQGRLDGGR